MDWRFRPFCKCANAMRAVFFNDLADNLPVSQVVYNRDMRINPIGTSRSSGTQRLIKTPFGS